MSKKEREIGNSNGILRYLFCCCSNLSIDDIISLRPGLRMGIDFRGQVWKWVWKISDIFWCEIGSGFGEPGGTPPPRIPRITPLPPPPPLSPSHCAPVRKTKKLPKRFNMQLNSFHLNYGYVGTPPSPEIRVECSRTASVYILTREDNPLFILPFVWSYGDRV